MGFKQSRIQSTSFSTLSSSQGSNKSCKDKCDQSPRSIPFVWKNKVLTGSFANWVLLDYANQTGENEYEVVIELKQDDYKNNDDSISVEPSSIVNHSQSLVIENKKMLSEEPHEKITEVNDTIEKACSNLKAPVQCPTFYLNNFPIVNNDMFSNETGAYSKIIPRTPHILLNHLHLNTMTKDNKVIETTTTIRVREKMVNFCYYAPKKKKS